MKSLLVSSIYFPPVTGGIAEMMGGLATTLGPERVCCVTGVPADGETAGLGPRVYRIPLAFSARRKAVRAAAWGAAVSRLVARERPRAVLLATADDGHIGQWLRRWLRLPYVVYAHGNEILDALRPGRERPQRTLRDAACVIAVSRFTAGLVQWAGVEPERIAVVHPGCDVHRFRPRPAREDLRQKLLGSRHRDRVILTTGNLVARKGHDMVIRALPRLLAHVPDVTYLLVGDGPQRDELQALAATLGVRDRVVFAGRAEPEDLVDVYAVCDVFVMASRARIETADVEGFGIVFLEANACGKPVVGGRSGGVPEAVADGVSGLLVDPLDPEAIAAALTRLLTDTELARRLGGDGRLRVVREFDWARVAARVEAVLGLARGPAGWVRGHAAEAAGA